MGAKIIICFSLIVLVASPVYSAEWLRREKTGMEDGKTILFYKRLFGDEKRVSIKRTCLPNSLCLAAYHVCDPCNCPGIPFGWICCCPGWTRTDEGSFPPSTDARKPFAMKQD